MPEVTQTKKPTMSFRTSHRERNLFIITNKISPYGRNDIWRIYSVLKNKQVHHNINS